MGAGGGRGVGAMRREVRGVGRDGAVGECVIVIYTHNIYTNIYI